MKYMRKKVLGVLTVCCMIAGIGYASAASAQMGPMMNQEREMMQERNEQLRESQTQEQQRLHVYTAQLSGENEVPPVETNASGTALFIHDPENQTVRYRVGMMNIDQVTEAHLHCAMPDENGPAFIPLNVQNIVQQDNQRMVQGTWTEQDLMQAAQECNPAIEDMNNLVEAINNGRVYLNVHSDEYPNGEIRGHLTQVEAQIQTGNTNMQVYPLEGAPEGMNAFLVLVSDELLQKMQQHMQMMQQHMRMMQQFQVQPQE